MSALTYERAGDLGQAIASVSGNSSAAYLAGGTTQTAFDEGTAIIRQGEVGDAFYLLTEGEG